MTTSDSLTVILCPHTALTTALFTALHCTALLCGRVGAVSDTGADVGWPRVGSPPTYARPPLLASTTTSSTATTAAVLQGAPRELLVHEGSSRSGLDPRSPGDGGRQPRSALRLPSALQCRLHYTALQCRRYCTTLHLHPYSSGPLRGNDAAVVS